MFGVNLLLCYLCLYRIIYNCRQKPYTRNREEITILVTYTTFGGSTVKYTYIVVITRALTAGCVDNKNSVETVFDTRQCKEYWKYICKHYIEEGVVWMVMKTKLFRTASIFAIRLKNCYGRGVSKCKANAEIYEVLEQNVLVSGPNEYSESMPRICAHENLDYQSISKIFWTFFPSGCVILADRGFANDSTRYPIMKVSMTPSHLTGRDQ